jgi:hypothetical protein
MRELWMDDTTLLYVLSTLAQTCAALVAFVGFVGLNQLQVWQQRRTAVHDEIAAIVGSSTDVLSIARGPRFAEQGEITRRVRRWDSIGTRIRGVRCALVGFEVVQLLVILVALAGFPFVDTLKNCWLTSVGLWILASMAVGSTGFCVLAWLREGKDFKED